MSRPVLEYCSVCGAADRRAVDVQARGPLVGGRGLLEVHRAGVRRAQRIEQRERSRLVEGVRIGRIERRDRRRRGVRGQIQHVFDVGGGRRRRVGGLQAQVAETAGVEAAAGERRIDLQALLLRVDHEAVAIQLVRRRRACRRARRRRRR